MRKSKEHVLAMAAHGAEEGKPSLKVYCPLLKGGGSRHIVYCIYKCPKGRLIKCKEYTLLYPELVNYPIEQFYIDRYGDPNILVPVALRKRRRRRAISD
ncbi:hypothetical protein [Geobacter sp. SVR]|uniref:hypothetical protein n=1 Tax=Geobacter sp. SVR TaxID=2495594 RepID=UPI00143F048B|nr:hypothetical protein [Geobacter sp. SVR]BCS54097.1 hypothetical protein GSVR_24050 [Geobacter sp. SVR]GCF87580.1 hypothetical protein GSbR_41800 [Geobacter sp. SVR]